MLDGQCRGRAGPQGKGSESRKMRKDGFVYVDLRERAEGIGCQAESVVGARIGSSRMDDICRDFPAGKKRTLVRILLATRLSA